ncbi:DUF5675 family protein [Dyadobacter sp. LHD-138]|uniref:DUF5675 family protein n=1 Tax=Dyadobacter sp. LHD-138 TaxID=3071413 RepID=UPI0027DF27B3|nr:DUF5675 family protein [Dyadobacter sp. LHD-138]MDQ6479786.1 DUF5675 family protein [Dyadobacter sp. LHD-138]
MEIFVTRRWRGVNSTVSSVTVDGQAHHFILEDRDRGLKSDMPLADIKREKVYGKTAIPTGRYQVAVTYSNRFKRLLPILVNVPGFAGIRIHPGNRHIDTEGCLLPGKGYAKEEQEYIVTTSRTACDVLFLKINEALKKGEEVWCTIVRTYP